MDQIIECVPNFSEGRDPVVLNAIAASFLGNDLRLLDFSADPDHNRCVATVAGEPRAVLEGILSAVGQAVRRIDMTVHKGEHPAIGAADVIPLIPLKGLTEADAVEFSRVLAQMLAARYALPIYLYGASAVNPDRRELPEIRKGGFAALHKRMKQIEWLPNFGPSQPHPTAGATVVGARDPLIAFNVDLATADLAIAKKIATDVRERDGGLKTVRALGLSLGGRGMTQVSMNLTDYTTVSVVKAFDRVKELAEDRGVAVAESEIVGLVPRASIEGVEPSRILFKGDLTDKILENKLPEEWQ